MIGDCRQRQSGYLLLRGAAALTGAAAPLRGEDIGYKVYLCLSAFGDRIKITIGISQSRRVSNDEK